MSGAYLIRADGITEIDFDAVESETHPDVSIVTAHPIELGADVVDHVRSEPSVVSLQVLVSNSPMRGTGNLRTITFEPPQPQFPMDGTPGALYREAKALFSSPAEVSATVYEQDGKDRIEEYQQTLDQIRRSAELVAVVTMSRVYYDCVIVRSELQRTKFGHGSFALDFRIITKVETRSVAAPQPTEPRGQGKQSKGSQATAAAKEVDTKKLAKSFLVQGGEGAFSFLQGLGG